MTKLTKIKAGLYQNELGTIRNIASQSGAPHTRSASARWLVTFANGKNSLASNFSLAKMFLSGCK